MIEHFKNVCDFRKANPGTPGNAQTVNDPILLPVKNDLNQIKMFLFNKYSSYKGFSFSVEASQGQGNFPSILHVCILPPKQSVSNGIYVAICFDILGRGALVGCAESVTHPQGLATEIRKTNSRTELKIDVDGSKRAEYNNAFGNPKEFFSQHLVESELLEHIEESLDLALYHLKLFSAPDLNIANRVVANLNTMEFDPSSIIDGRDKITRQITARRGQSKFRNELLLAYDCKCAVTGSDVESVLEAAHIIPYAGAQTNHVQNGLLLRSDIHLLFDLGKLTIEANTRVVKIHSELTRTYYSEFGSKPMFLPMKIYNQPSNEALRYHNESEFGKKIRARD